MSKDKSEFYKELLLKEKKDLIEELMDEDETAKNLLENDLQNVNDSVDFASSRVTQSILSVMNANAKKKITAIDAALRRIDEKTFGICISCGVEIAEKRLLSVPWATQCIECKRKSETKMTMSR